MGRDSIALLLLLFLFAPHANYMYLTQASHLRDRNKVHLLRSLSTSNFRKRPKNKHCKRLHAFLELHESVETTSTTTTSSCAILDKSGDTVDPCKAFDPGHRHTGDNGGIALQHMGMDALKMQYENTETAMCNLLIERMIPTILADDRITQSDGFPDSYFKDGSVRQCSDLRRLKKSLDNMWRTAILEGKYIHSGGPLKNDDNAKVKIDAGENIDAEENVNDLQLQNANPTDGNSDSNSLGETGDGGEQRDEEEEEEEEEEEDVNRSLRVSTGTVMCCYNSMCTGMYPVGTNVPLKTNRANKYAHVPMCHERVRRTVCSVCAYGARVVHHFLSNS